MIDVNFYSGEVTYDEFHIDFTIPYSEQLDCLKEDLLQVRYEGGYLLDVGWYPEYEPQGMFLVLVTSDVDWSNPIYKRYSRSKSDLIENIKQAIKSVEKLKNR